MGRGLADSITCVMFSVETTSAYFSGSVFSRRCARPMAMTPALQPMPPRLNDRMSSRILKRLTSMADREGVGQKREQLTTRMSMSLGDRPVRHSSQLQEEGQCLYA